MQRSDRRRPQSQPARRRADLAHLAHATHGALLLLVVLGAVEGAGGRRHAAVEGRVRGRAHVEVGEGVELDGQLVCRVELALGFRLLRLEMDESARGEQKMSRARSRARTGSE